MKSNRIGVTIIGVLIAAISISSCTYRSHSPVYDNGYGYGYGYHHRYYQPPRRVVVVRPAPPRPQRVYRSNGHAKPYDSRSSRNNNNSRQYSQNNRSRGPR